MSNKICVKFSLNSKIYLATKKSGKTLHFLRINFGSLLVLITLWGIIKDILEKEEPKTFQLWVAKINEMWNSFKLDVIESLNKSMK